MQVRLIQEYHQAPLNRPCNQCRNEFHRYISGDNDADIPSAIGRWRNNHRQYQCLALMARDGLAVPASGCAVEHQSIISGRMAVWQCSNHLSPSVISDARIFKAALAHTRCPLTIRILHGNFLVRLQVSVLQRRESDLVEIILLEGRWSGEGGRGSAVRAMCNCAGGLTVLLELEWPLRRRMSYFLVELPNMEGWYLIPTKTTVASRLGSALRALTHSLTTSSSRTKCSLANESLQRKGHVGRHRCLR